MSRNEHVCTEWVQSSRGDGSGHGQHQHKDDIEIATVIT